MPTFAPLYVGTMNDGLFIIDQPPRPAPKDEDTGTLHATKVIATMANNDREASKLANLIAAAPNLFEVVQTLDDLINQLANERTPANVEMTPAELALVRFRKHTRAALTKAEGK